MEFDPPQLIVATGLLPSSTSAGYFPRFEFRGWASRPGAPAPGLLHDAKKRVDVTIGSKIEIHDLTILKLKTRGGV